MGILPGLARMVGWIATDESRHIAYGTYLISRLVAEHGEAVYDTFMGRMSELMPLAVGVVEYIYRRYEPPYPFGITQDVFLEHGYRLMSARVSVIEKARGMEPRQVYYMHMRELEIQDVP
jgi:ribonucleoside-diphosphate reductase beta chain